MIRPRTFIDPVTGERLIIGGNTATEQADIISTLGEWSAATEHRRQHITEAINEARIALAWNQAYLAIPTPLLTQALVAQQVRRLTQENTGIIKVLASVVRELADVLDADHFVEVADTVHTVTSDNVVLT